MEGEAPCLFYYLMDATIISAIIAGCTAILVNIISNMILSARQTALIEYRLKQLEDSLNEIRRLPERVTVLETHVQSLLDERGRTA